MFILQPALLTLQLLQQRTANATDANHKHFDNLIGIEQHLMSNAICMDSSKNSTCIDFAAFRNRYGRKVAIDGDIITMTHQYICLLYTSWNFVYLKKISINLIN